MKPNRTSHRSDLSERDICSKFISPSVKRAGWDGMTQIREEVAFTKGRIIVRGKLVTRGKAKRADYILYYKPNIPIAIIEAKDNNHSVGDGMQQALDYHHAVGTVTSLRLTQRCCGDEMHLASVRDWIRRRVFGPVSYTHLR